MLGGPRRLLHNSPLVDTLRELVAHVDGVVDSVHRDGLVAGASDADQAAALELLGRLGRRVDSALIEVVSEVTARSESPVRDERLTARLGCRSVNELVQRTTRLGPQTAGRLERAARAVRQGRSPFSGELGPATLPAMREALLDGEVGLDGVLAVAEPLSSLASGVSREALLVADQVLAAEARGEGPDGSPALCADLLKVQARVWAVVLDQDGAEPRERQALLKRALTLGPARDGLVPIQGRLLPDVAAQLQRIFDASLSPKVAGDGVRFVEADASDPASLSDDRRRPQQQHDAFAGALAAAAVSGELPTIGGAAPTLVVSVQSEDLASGHGWAHTEGTDEPLSLTAARHIGCAGAIQRVLLGDDGRILRLGTEERVFNRYQRRAIALRDGGCIIPGCGVPAGWCEIHHVTAHAQGGRPTPTTASSSVGTTTDSSTETAGPSASTGASPKSAPPPGSTRGCSGAPSPAPPPASATASSGRHEADVKRAPESNRQAVGRRQPRASPTGGTLGEC